MNEGNRKRKKKKYLFFISKYIFRNKRDREINIFDDERFRFSEATHLDQDLRILTRPHF